jgi:DNA modification methylase
MAGEARGETMTKVVQTELFEQEGAHGETREDRSPRRCNDLDGATWLRYSISVWGDIRKTAEESQLNHPAMFPSMLVQRLIQMLTLKRQKVILDPFVGSGSTAIGAIREGKQAIGLDTSAQYIELARRRCHDLQTLWDRQNPCPEPLLIVADARTLLSHVKPRTVDLCITSPPYWNILGQKRTADYKAVRHYGNLTDDLSTISDYGDFLKELKSVFRQVFVATRPNRYCVVVVMDLRKGRQFYSLHSDVARMMSDIGFLYDDLIVWNRKSDYNNLRPLGYPAVFRVNKVHEFILVFRTPESKQKTEFDWRILDQVAENGVDNRAAGE